MKKLIALALCLVLLLVSVSAFADITLMQNKVEIDAVLQEFAAAYTAETGKVVKIITAGGSTDYNTALKAEFNSGVQPDIFVIEGPSHYELYKDYIATMIKFGTTTPCKIIAFQTIEFVCDSMIMKICQMQFR